jgi:phosphate starvation-inducible protein PhoH and related proteins
MRSILPFLLCITPKHGYGKQIHRGFTKSFKYQPSNLHQQQYLQQLRDPTSSICVGIGPAGTGKTMLACLAAIEALQRGNIQKIIFTRPSYPVQGETLGFLPGDIDHKMKPWIQPMMDVFLEHYSSEEITYMQRKEILETVPLAFMRGRTFKHTYILADEIQNTTPEQVLMLTTRLGEHSTMVITGDLEQSDLGPNNGLQDFLQRIQTPSSFPPGISLTQFEKSDVLRSPIVNTILSLYAKPSNRPSFPEHSHENYEISTLEPLFRKI